MCCPYVRQQSIHSDVTLGIVLPPPEEAGGSVVSVGLSRQAIFTVLVMFSSSCKPDEREQDVRRGREREDNLPPGVGWGKPVVNFRQFLH